MPIEDRISSCQILKTTIADMEAQLSSSAQPTHKAPSLFVMIVIVARRSWTTACRLVHAPWHG